ncbi:DUF2059 domain-containing protein [Xanthobacter sp. AM11]|uniref:DUF2059 domain-containing protein n=1 Tax=Xanthobacter sp. AM11 TaxID=3380643 RepID=UPI0039BF08ED
MRIAYAMLVVAAVLCPAAAMADEATDKAALARQVAELSVEPGLDGRVGRMIGQVVEKLPADRQGEARTVLLKESAGIRADLLLVFATYYASAFTLDELKQLAAFYASPLGRKLVRVEEEKPAEVNASIQQQIMKLVVLFNTPGAGSR